MPMPEPYLGRCGRGGGGGGGMAPAPGGVAGQTKTTGDGAWSTTKRLALPRLLGPRW